MSDASEEKVKGSSAEPTAPRRIVMLSGDLMFASKVRSVAENLGMAFAFGGHLPEGSLEDVHTVILDLGTRGGLAGSLKSICDERCPNAKLIAFGPHVQPEKMQRAKDSGISHIMTNGQFDRSLHLLFS